MTFKPIILYDIDSTTKIRAWSPNTWKTRFILNFKGLPYETHWLEFPEIKPYFLSIGMEPSEISKDGGKYYLVPAITDPNNLTANGKPTMVAESFRIAEYLEKTYPEHGGSTSIFPSGTKQLQKFLMNYFDNDENLIKFTIDQLIVRRTHGLLKHGSQEYFKTTVMKNFGVTLEDKTDAAKLEAALEGTRKGFDKIASYFATSQAKVDQGFFVLENQNCYADFVLGGILIWMRDLANEEVWSKVKTWNDGHWERFLNALEKKYGQVN